ncbi:S-layer homology domain-containing protein [Anaerobacillus sp. HL2]|nr:S-layer homology domain-containing protein [Anaerobacillus sp. HL2]
MPSNLMEKNEKPFFHDVPENHFASGYIQSAADAKIINKLSNGTFGLNNSMTREEWRSY